MTGREIMQDLKQYGISEIYEGQEYSPDEYYPLKFIFLYLSDKAYLPELAELLTKCSDDDLVYKDTNALMWASRHYLPTEKLRMLSDRKDFIAAHIHDRDAEGKAVLHYAARNYWDDPEPIRLLVKWGADVNAKDNYGWTPLHEAARLNQSFGHVLDALRELGAISVESNSGETPEALRDWMDAIDAW